MPAGVDRIDFDRSEEWELVANEVRNAVLVGENAYEPIPAFNLGLDLYTDYVAVIATTTSGKPTWQFAGDINQVYNFPKGTPDNILGRIQPARARLFINKMQLIDTGRVSLDNFDLRYTPPYWFRDCAIRVYRYVGEVKNFVEDTLFDIGNALGINDNSPTGTIIEGLLALKLDLETQFQTLSERLDQDNTVADDEFIQILTQLNQIDAGVYTVVEAVAELLPPARGDEYKQTAQQRLELDLGFLWLKAHWKKTWY